MTQHRFEHGEIPETIFRKNVIVSGPMLFYGVFIIYTYIKVKSFRKKPGDLFTMIGVLDIFGVFSQLTSAMNS